MYKLKPFVLTSICIFCFTALLFAGSSADTDADKNIDIPHQKFILDNGLTLNLWYHVGS